MPSCDATAVAASSWAALAREAGARRLLAAVVALLVASATARAQTSADLGLMSIEELMRVEVTAASRKDQRAWDVAAAVFVISQDDIRRSGMTTLPDLLRLVPGANVAQINSNKWAVSVRGFNTLYANKLLVLVDGRSVYNRIFSGVAWDAIDLMVDDIDRIEVVRGPGAALWGANAVNGVINIVSKSSAGTQGTLARVDVGSGQQGAVRYGGMLKGTPIRVHAQWTERNQSQVAGAEADDPSRSFSSGFRTDWRAGQNAVLLVGGFTAGQSNSLFANLDPLTSTLAPISTERSDAISTHLLGRWTRTMQDGDSLQVQSFVDTTRRDEPVGDYDRHAFDLDAHYRTALSARHDLVVGAGYRFVGEQLHGKVGFALTPSDDHSSLLTAFAQDEVDLGGRVQLTLGSQVQYQGGVGAAVQPTARVMWRPLPAHRVWAAVSRAVRTPSLADQGLRLEYPPVATASGLPLYAVGVGNPDAKSESFVDAEAGYRVEIGASAVLDVTGFAGRYANLQTNEAGAPVIELVPSPRIVVTSTFGNQLAATTRGVEVSGHWAPRPDLQLDASVTAFDLHPTLSPASLDPIAALERGSASGTQWQVRAAYAPTARAMFNLGVFHVGPIDQLRVAGYTRADVSAEWRLTPRLSLMAIGQNLLDATHFEFEGSSALVRATQVPRSGGLRLRWVSR